MFLEALASHSFMQNALIGGILASVACGVMGTYVVVKRIGFLAGGIAHTVLGGMGIAYFLGANPIKQFLAVSFDEEFARLRGVHVDFFYLLLLVMVALTVVILIQVVGLILVIALLTLPAAIAVQYLRSLVTIMLFATVLGIAFTSGGLALSYAPDLPAGATIILLAGAVYLVSLVTKALLTKYWRRQKQT